MLWGCNTTSGSVSRRFRYAQIASRAVAHKSLVAMRQLAGAAAATQLRTAAATITHAAASLALSPLGRQAAIAVCTSALRWGAFRRLTTAARLSEQASQRPLTGSGRAGRPTATRRRRLPHKRRSGYASCLTFRSSRGTPFSWRKSGAAARLVFVRSRRYTQFSKIEGAPVWCLRERAKMRKSRSSRRLFDAQNAPIAIAAATAECRMTRSFTSYLDHTLCYRPEKRLSN